MAMGPVQVLVVGFGADAEFKGAGLEELKKLRDHDIVRVIDLIVVHKNDDGSIDKIEITDDEEIAKLGAFAGALIGFGAAGEEGAEVGAVVGAEAALEEGSVYDDEEVWYLADAIPEGFTAAIAVLEHRWAIPLRNAVMETGGVLLTDKWLHPQDLLAIGAEIGLELED
ncbi:MAG: DUF6325 family protein [Actinomycetes bacterium]